MSDEHQADIDATQPAARPGVGPRLRAAREAQGMSVADVASHTRIVQRYVAAVERGDYADLPSRTYAVGFAKAYARAVGVDEVEIGRDTRAEVAAMGEPRPQFQLEEIADPARAPSRGLVVVAAGIALAVLILGALWFATGVFRGTSATPENETAQVIADVPAPSAAAPAAAPTAPAAGGPVVLTATDEVWLRIYDAADNRLFLGTMKPGDRFEVPANANRPMVNVGRPDKLAITIGGRAVPPLGDGKRAMKDVDISAAALLARPASPGATQPVPAASGTAPAPAASVSTAVPPAFAPPPANR